MSATFNQDGYRITAGPDEIPKDSHYAVIEFGSMYIEGDERSREAPGHGYPGHTVTTTQYVVFQNKVAWEHYISRLMTPTYGSKTPFVAIEASPVECELKVSVTTKPVQREPFDPYRSR